MKDLISKRYIKKVHTETISLYILSFIVCIVMASLVVGVKQSKVERPVFLRKETISSVMSPYNHTTVDESGVLAKAYIIYDISSGDIIASRNPYEVLPLASLTKIITTLTAVHNASSTKEIITVDPSFLDGGYDFGLKNKQSWNLDELLKYMLLLSSNDAAYLVANHFGGKEKFVNYMNTFISMHNMSSSTVVTDPAGLDIADRIGGKGSAFDVARLFSIARKEVPILLDATTKKRQTLKSNQELLRGIPNTNQEIENLSGAEASKTGYTNLAGGNLAVIVDPVLGHPVVIVVLGSTRDGRFDDVALLYNYLQKNIKIQSVSP